MATVDQLHAKIVAVQDSSLTDGEIDELVTLSDASVHKQFFGKDKEASKERVKEISSIVVNKFLNNPDVNVVPIRTKTRYLLLLNNLALYKPVRGKVFDAVKHMDSFFEEAMKKEGTMPFDSELGRMSEHVLVLLMRVCQYKFKAAAVNEFAEGNTQFGVQLLLAILLKEPPYEFELRCNCISGLLGFTQPQAFFSAGDSIEFNSCTSFSEKVDFILSLMMRLASIQVVNDVITPQLLEYPTVQPIVHLAITNTMRCVMNIFQFATQGATQWRQHILLSTSFVDGCTILYLQSQIRSLESLLTISMSQASPSLPPEMLPGITLALKFMGFATFHMGQHVKGIRPCCAFIHDLLTLPIGAFIGDATLGKQFLSLFTQLFHLMANIDALAGDDVGDADELIPELYSATLKESLRKFANNEIAAGGGQALEQWHNKFYAVDTDALVSHDSVTFQQIDEVFISVKQQRGGAPPAPAPAQAQTTDSKRLLGDMPTVGKSSTHGQKKKLDEAVHIQQNFVAPKGLAAAVSATSSHAVNGEFVCALNGHTMKCPVTSPYGHTFEKETIEQWIRQQGSICPITGKPLSLSDLKVNRELQNKIMHAVVAQTMQQENQEDAVDLYDF